MGDPQLGALWPTSAASGTSGISSPSRSPFPTRTSPRRDRPVVRDDRPLARAAGLRRLHGAVSPPAPVRAPPRRVPRSRAGCRARSCSPPWPRSSRSPRTPRWCRVGAVAVDPAALAAVRRARAAGAFIGSWRVGDDGPVDALRARSSGCRGRGASCPSSFCAESRSRPWPGGRRGSGRGRGTHRALDASDRPLPGEQRRRARGDRHRPRSARVPADPRALGRRLHRRPRLRLGTDTAITPAATQVGRCPASRCSGRSPTRPRRGCCCSRCCPWPWEH